MTDEPAVPVPPRTGADIRGLLELLVRASGACEELFARHGAALSVAQWAALDMLVQGGAQRPFQLARKLCISRQRAWQVARALEAAGHVTLADDGAGKGGMFITVTESGIAAFRSLEVGVFDPVAARMTADRPDLAFSGVRAALRTLVDACEALAEKDRADPGRGAAAEAERNNE